VTIELVFAILAAVVVAIFGLRRLRRDPSTESDNGRVSQSWLMERRADGQRDRFE
jgi:hypothetical protein